LLYLALAPVVLTLVLPRNIENLPAVAACAAAGWWLSIFVLATVIVVLLVAMWRQRRAVSTFASEHVCLQFLLHSLLNGMLVVHGQHCALCSVELLLWNHTQHLTKAIFTSGHVCAQ
jgi:dolichyl-phosphate-mannose--protein O-mannosyl transferase